MLSQFLQPSMLLSTSPPLTMSLSFIIMWTMGDLPSLSLSTMSNFEDRPFPSVALAPTIKMAQLRGKSGTYKTAPGKLSSTLTGTSQMPSACILGLPHSVTWPTGTYHLLYLLELRELPTSRTFIHFGARSMSLMQGCSRASSSPSGKSKQELASTCANLHFMLNQFLWC